MNETESEDSLEERELVLLCLDYLRDIRRNYAPDLLQSMEGIDAEYLTMACWALNRAFVKPKHLTVTAGNDCFSSSCKSKNKNESKTQFPTLPDMEQELLSGDYEYDDAHASNLHRFYPLAGLSSQPPLSLAEITSAGLAAMQARSRLAAERDMIQSGLFEQFLEAVHQKGFFDDPENEGARDDPAEEEERITRKQQVYDDRYRKVVAKFRSKLARKAESEQSQPVQRRRPGDNEEREVESVAGTEASYIRRTTLAQKFLLENENQQPNHQDDLEEAEKLKTRGNTHMQQKEYQEAAGCYTAALKLSPAGLQSHVYYSNRAAALVSMKRYEEAILDSERSLALKGDYGKAHARLGLAHFLLGNYRQAMEAYTVALKYEPDNQSSKNYLEKAAKRLAERGLESNAAQPTSFSVVSEWDKPRNENYNEAERYKVKGNTHMADREYSLAVEAYTHAIQCAPDGHQSHVYYSNRAAALCYLERYQEAEEDSLYSLKLNPTYGKAHARLGLSRFFLQDYEGAVLAYEKAIKFDPDNSASKSYLLKAKAKIKDASLA